MQSQSVKLYTWNLSWTTTGKLVTDIIAGQNKDEDEQTIREGDG